MAILSHYPGLDDISSRLLLPALVFSIVTPLVVLARFITRSTHGNRLGPEDWTILASLCFAETVSIQMIICCEWGFGKHTRELPPPLVAKTLELYFFAQILYKITIGLTKTSILLFYIRVFGIWKSFRILCWVMIGLVVAFTTSSVVTSIFQCSPVRFAFDKKANGGHGTCIDLTKFWYANAGFNIGSDLIIILMPVLPVKNLNIPFRSKIALCAVFAVGIFVCITSILRFTTLNLATSHTDVMWQSIASSMWTVIEYNLGIIAASMPALRRPLASLFPMVFGHTKSGSSATLDGQGNRNANVYHRASSTISSASTKTSRPSLGQRTPAPSEKDERYRSGLRTEMFDLSEPEFNFFEIEQGRHTAAAWNGTEVQDWHQNDGIMRTTEFKVEPESKRSSINQYRVFPK